MYYITSNLNLATFPKQNVVRYDFYCKSWVPVQKTSTLTLPWDTRYQVHQLIQGLLEKGVRHRVLIYLSLLSSRNCQCATWLYKALLRSDALETFILKENVKDESLHSELLLLFTMGLYHPAFTFEQKSYIGGMLVVLVQQWDQRERGLHASPRPFSSYPPGLGIQQAQEPCVSFGVGLISRFQVL